MSRGKRLFSDSRGEPRASDDLDDRVGPVARLGRAAREVASASSSELAFAAAALALAPIVRAHLARAGLEATLAAIDRWAPARRPGRGDVSVARGRRLVRLAFRRGDGTCLPESLVQLALHRWFGPDVELVVGVQRGAEARPRAVGWELRAHAWIESAGDTPSDAASFQPILRRRLGG